jgi:glutamate N-acetyltransferase/amino-acid N-acetyltransferase
MTHYSEHGISVELSKNPQESPDKIFFSYNEENIEIKNSLTHQPQSITCAAKSLGIKTKDKIDFTVISFPPATTAAALFTKNACPSYTVSRNRELLLHSDCTLLAVNSGNANVFNPTGATDLVETAALLAKEFELNEDEIMVCSTGVIGVQLPMDKFRTGIPGIKSTLLPNNLDQAAKAILTTDRGPKVASVKIGELVLCAIAKGAGMIEPNMATMLAYFFTNGTFTKAELDQALRETCNNSFNSISIDSDTSTNDTLALFATGELDKDKSDINALISALQAMSIKLAREIVAQGEGVSKLIETVVHSDNSEGQSKKIAKSIINSPLLKAAVFGADPNWGRVVMAVGKACMDDSNPLHADQIQIKFQSQLVYDRGKGIKLDLDKISKDIKENAHCFIEVKIGQGRYSSRVWGSDLTHEYVDINASYTT